MVNNILDLKNHGEHDGYDILAAHAWNISCFAGVPKKRQPPYCLVYCLLVVAVYMWWHCNDAQNTVHSM